jgi:DNA-binding IclR family transcriptional regulator
MDTTVVKALRVLEGLARSEGACGVSEMSRALGLTKSNVHRLLKTLTHCGYVDRIDGGLYRLTPKLWMLGTVAIARRDVKDFALPYLQELKEETGETARLSVFIDDHAVCVAQVQSDHPVGVLTQVGGRLLAYCSATGKALLAHQPEPVIARVASLLAPHTQYTSTTEQGLREEMARIREEGFAINRGEWRESVAGVGAPVRDSTGRVIAAIGISGPTERLKYRMLRGYGPRVREAADAVSAALGYAAPEAPVAVPERMRA